MVGGKLLGELAQVGRKDLGLVLEDVVAKVQPKLPSIRMTGCSNSNMLLAWMALLMAAITRS